MAARIRRAFLWLLKRTLNRLTLALARRGRGPFSIVRHRGRRTGRRYETPLILAAVPGGFVAELTYGPHDERAGLAAFGPPASIVLRLLRRHEFRLLRTVQDDSGE